MPKTPDPYWQTLAKPVKTTLEVKKSRFIGHLAPCQNRIQGVEYIESIRTQYPDARHVCYGFVCGSPGNYSDYGFSDDGEPSGTAGKPILNVLEHNPISDICAVVVRYFGGVKLGAGGLVRAYSGATSQALAAAELITVIPKATLTIHSPYPLEDSVRHILGLLDASVLSSEYADNVLLQCEVATSEINKLKSSLQEISKNQAYIIE